MTNPDTKSNSECANFRNDYVECRRHRIETFKMTIMKEHLERDRPDLKEEDIGAPFVKKRDFLTPKTLGLVGGDDHAVAFRKL